MDVSRLRQGEKIAAIAGILLLVFMFLPWYGLGGQLGQFGDAAGIDTDVSAWGAFDLLDLLLFLIAAVAIAQAVLTASQNSPALPISANVITTAAGGLGTLLILYRILNQPGPNDVIDVKYGVFLGLLACAAIAYGGFKAMQDETTPGVAQPAPEKRPAPPASDPAATSAPAASAGDAPAASAAAAAAPAAPPPPAAPAASTEAPASPPPSGAVASTPAPPPAGAPEAAPDSAAPETAPLAAAPDSAPAETAPLAAAPDSAAAETAPLAAAPAPSEPATEQQDVPEPSPTFGVDEPEDRPPGAA
jgi:hypothetical protein